MTARDEKFFFVHVMKTGGSTLRAHMRANFERDEVYPWERLDRDLILANTQIDYLTALSPERRDRIRVFTGHFPFVAVELLGVDAITLTILRDPVERTISYLRATRRYQEEYQHHSLQQIYEDPVPFLGLIKNHQAKLFSLTLADQPESQRHVIDVDAERLALAKANLGRVDMVGLHERYDEFLATLERRFGWRFGHVGNWFVSRSRREVPASFRRRIAEDNQADMEFYEHACQLYDARRGGSLSA
jgi:Sulfotransferase family